MMGIFARKPPPKLPFKVLTPTLPPAPLWFYGCVFAGGVSLGIVLEASMINLGYYQLLIKGESKRLAQEADEEARKVVKPTLEW
ncbi:hypothetical protein QVD99_006209 [Batrachochytrium dendrobatidis]|nr:hypothetical protein QVD99_006209 [Batrachochytrium dendrobatidis]